MTSPPPFARRRIVVRLGLIAALALVVVVAAAVAGPGGDDSVAPAAQSRLFDGIPQDGIALGSPKARAVLTEFADLQCPFCAGYARDVLPTVVERYVRTGRLRLELHLLTFLGEDSVRSGAMAAAAAQQDRLWSFTDSFYHHQGAENSGYATDDFLRGIGEATPASTWSARSTSAAARRCWRRSPRPSARQARWGPITRPRSTCAAATGPQFRWSHRR
jgi:hypothetical protein